MNLKVLVVEDQFLEADCLRNLLERSGYRVQGVAKSVEQAMGSLSRELPDIVLLDIFLKGERNGIHLAAVLYQQNIPFIYLSANSNSTTLTEAMGTHPDGFLVKPFREQELLMAMDIALYRHQKNLEHIQRQKSWLTRLLDPLPESADSSPQTMQAFIRVLTSFLPMDYVVVDTDLHDRSAGTLYQFQRTGFDDFKEIDCSTTPDQSVFSSIDRYRRKHREHSTAYFLNDRDFVKDYEGDSAGETVRRARNLQATFWLPLKGTRNVSMGISFYSCSDERYTPEHCSLLTSLADLLSKRIEDVRRNSGNLPGRLRSSDHDMGSMPEQFPFEGIIGNSSKLLDSLDKVTKVAPFDNTVLVLGETGVGKEGLVTAIHQRSNRKNKPLIKVNCAAIPANLVESELFGHEKGAFTGALDRRIGKFEQAAGGTLFLDEIGELPMEVQSKLLRAIQEKEIERVGGRNTIRTDVRIITATNRDLPKEIAAGKFRLDLYYRINVFPITLPPLRERREDIPLLAHHFLQRLGSRVRPGSTFRFAPVALEQLLCYAWPGNIRELEHLIERHVLQARSNTIDSFEMPPPLPNAEFVVSVPREIKPFAEMDRDHIVTALKKSNGKVSGRGGAAELLELRPTTLTSKMKRLGIRWPLQAGKFNEG